MNNRRWRSSGTSFARRWPASSQLGPDQPLQTLGLDSITATTLAFWVERRFGVTISLRQLLGGLSLRQLAAEVVERPKVGRPRSTRGRWTAARREASSHCPAGQPALWFACQLNPHGDTYVIHRAFHVDGPLNADDMRAAVSWLLNRHPALRTVFQDRGGRIVQRALARSEEAFAFRVVGEMDERELLALLATEADRPFDLGRGPLFRLLMVRQSAERHTVLLSAHHLVTDLRSMALLVAELQQAYETLQQPAEITLPGPAASYEEFVRWQGQQLHGPQGERLGRFWQDELAGYLQPLELPSRPGVRPGGSDEAGRIPIHIDATDTSRLSALARQSCGATLYMATLAAYQSLLHRYSRQERFLVGSPTTGRSRPVFDGVMGYFVEHSRPASGLHPAAELPRGARARARHRPAGVRAPELPAPPRDPSAEVPRAPLQPAVPSRPTSFCSAASCWQRRASPIGLGESGAELPFGSLRLRSLPLVQRGIDFDLDLGLVEHGGELIGALKYRTERFAAETIAGMVEAFRVLLRAALDNPDRPVAMLPLLGERERTLLENRNGERYRKELRLEQLFEAVARARPDAPATVWRDVVLTYGQVNQRAARLAAIMRGAEHE